MAFDRNGLEGVADLKAALDSLGTEVATRIGVRAQRAAALALRDEMILTAPFDPNTNSRYGHLRENIAVRKLRARKQHSIIYAVHTGSAFWGAFQEFGTVKMPPRPWMSGAFHKMRGELVDVQIDVLSDGIERAAKRLARNPRSRPSGSEQE